MASGILGASAEPQTARAHRKARMIAVSGGVALLKVALPLLRRQAERAFHRRCKKMVHEMEFGERPSCEMCYRMHRAMHRRMEREPA